MLDALKFAITYFYFMTKKRVLNRIFALLLTSVVFVSCTNENKPKENQKPVASEEEDIPEIVYSLVKTFPHDTTSYTQGFLVYNKQLFESTGSPEYMTLTRSVMGILDSITGKINIKAELDRKKHFGEGIAILNNKIYQLTWKNQSGFTYDAKTFKPLSEFTFESKEGWGLTTDGTNLIMSDGTNTLSYLDPTTLKVIKKVETPYINLNELEFIKGYIYANVYQKDFIVKIDPANGKVLGIVNLSSLAEKALSKSKGSEVLNGIAYDAASDRIFVTGKLWPQLYEIKFEH